MQPSVSQAISELEKQFAPSEVSVVHDGAGGALVIVEDVGLGARYTPSRTWIGGHITPLYPYADIYPLFIGQDIRRVDGVGFQPPVTPGTFAGRQAWQVSRRNPTAEREQQKATTKFLKVLSFLETLS